MPKLLRKLNLLDTTFLVIGAVIGSGIFMTTGFIAEYLPSPGLILIVWFAGGIIALFGALSFAELGAMMPKSGGQYIYLQEAFGPWAGFFYGWGCFWVMKCGAIAALAVGFVEYLSYFIPFLSTQSYVLEMNMLGITYSLSKGQIFAVITIILLSMVNCLGIKEGISVHNIFTFLKLASVVALIILAFSIGKKTEVLNFREIFNPPMKLNIDAIKYFGMAFIAVFWTYAGWYTANFTAGEIKKPEKNLPLSLFLGTLSVTFVYVLVNVVYIMALPVEKMKGVVRIGEVASTQLFGPGVTIIITAAIMISIFGCLSAIILSGPRIYFAMADDGVFFKNMAYVHPRFRVPTKAISGQALWASLLCISGTFKDLYEFAVFALVIFLAATGLAVIVLRYKQPRRKRPYKVWGYPIIPLIFLIINLIVFLNTIYAQPIKSGIGLFIILLGIPAFLYWRTKKKNRL